MELLKSAIAFGLGFLKRIWLGVSGVVQPAIQLYNENLAPLFGWPQRPVLREDVHALFVGAAVIGLFSAAAWTFHDLRMSQPGTKSLPDLGNEAMLRWSRLHAYFGENPQHDDAERHRIFFLQQDDFRKRLRAAGVRTPDLDQLCKRSFGGRWTVADLRSLHSALASIAIALGVEREHGSSDWVEHWTGKNSASESLASTPETDFSSAPILRWLDPAAALYQDGTIAVNVSCENSGRSESVAVVMRHDAEWHRPDGSSLPEAMRFEQFNIPSYIHSIHSDPNARFLMRIRSLYPSQASELGEKEIRWWVLYYDNEMEHGYIAEASLVANFVGRGLDGVIVGQPSLDTTSPRERHARFLEWIKDHRAPTT